MDLSSLFGNAPLKAQLEHQVSCRGLSHAYILSAPPLMGKHTLATLLAAALVCSSPEEARKPCGACPGCRKAFSHIHPDVIWAGGEGKGLTVDGVRELRAQAYIRPNEAPRKVFLLENCEAMNLSAQNAMLKLLEEGPAYAAFLLLTDSLGALLQTVRSRCEVLTLSPLSGEELLEALAIRFPSLSPQARAQAAAEAEGSLGRAMALLTQEAPSPATQEAPRLVLALSGGEELALYRAVLPLESWSREELSALFSEVRALLFAALALRQGAGCRELGEERLRAIRAAAALEPPVLLSLIRLLDRLVSAAGFNVHPAHLAGWLCAAAGEVFSKK